MKSPSCVVNGWAGGSLTRKPQVPLLSFDLGNLVKKQVFTITAARRTAAARLKSDLFELLTAWFFSIRYSSLKCCKIARVVEVEV